MTTTRIIYKGHNSPFLQEIIDIDSSIYLAAEMEGITRAYIKYIPADGEDAEYADSGNIFHSSVFDWETYETTGRILIDLGGINFTAGRDTAAELVIYDAVYTSGRVVALLDLLITEDEVGDLDLVDAGSADNIVYVLADYDASISEFGKTIVMIAATLKYIQLPTVTSTHDGQSMTFIRGGAGDLDIYADGVHTVVNSTHTKLTGSTTFASVKLKYVHALGTWVGMEGSGSWRGGTK